MKEFCLFKKLLDIFRLFFLSDIFCDITSLCGAIQSFQVKHGTKSHYDTDGIDTGEAEVDGEADGEGENKCVMPQKFETSLFF